MESQDPLVMVFERNAFYRRQYFLALLVFALSLSVIIVLSSMLYYVIRNPVKPLFFATDSVGRLIDVVPTSEPNMTTDDVIKWATQAVEAAYSYDYVNYRAQLQATQKYFSDYGWEKYMAALTASNNLVALKDRQMIITATVVSQPTVLTQGLLAGAYAWKLEMPLLVTYWLPPYDDNSKFSNAIDITIIVRRQPILQSNKGLGILQIIGKSISTPPASSVTTPAISNVPTS